MYTHQLKIFVHKQFSNISTHEKWPSTALGYDFSHHWCCYSHNFPNHLEMDGNNGSQQPSHICSLFICVLHNCLYINISGRILSSLGYRQKYECGDCFASFSLQGYGTKIYNDIGRFCKELNTTFSYFREEEG